MTDPQHHEGSAGPVLAAGGDKVTAILVAVTEIRGDLKSALQEQGRHTTAIDKHDDQLGRFGERLTAVETTVAGMPKKAVPPAAVWAALALAVASLAALISFLAIGH